MYDIGLVYIIIPLIKPSSCLIADHQMLENRKYQLVQAQDSFISTQYISHCVFLSFEEAANGSA